MGKNKTSLELLAIVADNLNKVETTKGVNGEILMYRNADSNPYIYNSFGLCGFLRTLFMEQIISNDEKQILTKILEMNKPRISPNNLFWWPTTDVYHVSASGKITFASAEEALSSRQLFISTLILKHM